MVFFASSCENMPNIYLKQVLVYRLLVQIRTNERILDDAGIYFDPRVGDTFKAMTDLIVNFKKDEKYQKYKLSLGFMEKML